MKKDNAIPRWQREIETFKGIKSTFIIEGNVTDGYYPSYDQNGDLSEFAGLNRTLLSIFESTNTAGFYQFLFCDPLDGFTDPLGRDETAQIVARCETQVNERKRALKALNGTDKPESHNDTKLLHASEIIREALTQASTEPDDVRKSVAVVINFASNCIGASSPSDLQIDDTTFFMNLLYASLNAIHGKRFINTLILIVNKFNDVPTWFYYNNPNVRTISIPNPERKVREDYIAKYFRDLGEPQNQLIRDKFIDLTDGMKLTEVAELRKLHQKLRKPIAEIADTVSIYKYGFKDSPWEEIRDKVGDNMKEKIERRVKGQEIAVDKIVQIIKRSVTGLSGMQHSSESSKPRGIVFLAGPTGTGKTEIVKTVTEMLFEDEKALIRFDMSEYTEAHADQKLFGAPPGYVGYDNGGQLTNAIKNNPFSIILFDEIEKAHPSIMDKFLQILEDGRMTDGQGNTVYFSETIIFFTSNVGISREIIDPSTGKVVRRENIVQPGEPYAKIQEKVEEAMTAFFKPEVMNRIGNNVVVFDYISESISKQIAQDKINKINQNIKKKLDIAVTVDNSFMEHLFKLCWEPKARADGGRGIGNVIEERYLNPLAVFIFDEKIREGDSIQVFVEDDAIRFSRGN